MPTNARRCVRLLAAALVVAVVTGCPRPPAERVTTTAEQDDPLVTVRETFRKDHTLDEFKSAVSQLNVYLAREKESPAGKLSDAEADFLRKQFNLNDAELKELGKGEFTPVDAHYLDECFLFQDGIQALKLPAGDELTRAKLAFAWVMRQVWLQERATRPLPAGVVLHVGRGNDIERMYATLAAWQQLGLDGCLIGHKDESGQARMWALGVRVGSDILLFDPRHGVPVAAADGQPVLALRQARANPDLLKSAAAGNEGADNVKQWVERSAVYLGPSLSSLSPRMRFLQTVFAGNQTANVGIDPAALQERFAETGEKTEFWNPPNSVATPTRVLIHFLPPEEGGLDREQPQFRLYYRYWEQLVPWQQMPSQLKMNQLRNLFALPFRRLLTDPKESKEAEAAEQSEEAKRPRLPFIRFLTESEGSGDEGPKDQADDPRQPLVKLLEHARPRDGILRGQFDEASRCLMNVLGHISLTQQRLAREPNLEADANQWMEQMLTAYGNMARAEKSGNVTDPAYLAAKGQVAELNRRAEKIILLIEKASAEPIAAEATYQMALCKHEQADRLQRIAVDDPAERETLHKAWQNAESWWNNFLTKYTAPAAQKAQAQELKNQAHAQVERVGGKK
ncbi:MAG TPA: hypothetical protein VKS79_16520 [Gemmataceae bacterium]|nr:hypothetical protein [Gemmataceae bacterium]